MPDSEVNGDFSQVLQQLMEKPEISNLIASLKSDTESTPKTDLPSGDSAQTEGTVEDAKDQGKTEEKAVPMQMPSLSPEMLAKLPAIMSMLSGMGIGASDSEPKDGGTPKKESEDPEKKSGSDDAQRKALLRALRPYLNTKRRTVVDSMLQLGDLTKLFGAGKER